MKVKFDVKNEPIWILEAACLISVKLAKEYKMFADSTDKGIKDEDLQIDFEKYYCFENAVSEEIMTILNSKYNKLKQFFLPNMSGNPIMLDFVLEYILREHSEINDEKIDSIMYEILQNIADNFVANSEKRDFIYNDLVSVINMLSKTSIEDKHKMQIINFYNDRFNLSRSAVSLIKEGEEILKKNFHIIEEEFNKAVNILMATDDLYDLCSKTIGLQLPQGEKCDVYTIIFSHYEVSVHSLYENYKQYLCFIGIYVFEMYEKKRLWKMNDTKAIADLKALGDATRYKIILMLSKKKMYLQELADELNLTPATISHHMNVLLRSNLISIIMDTDGSKKIYYQMNKEKVLELAKLIREFAEDI